MARVRTFIGVAINEEIRENALDLQRTLARAGAELKWVNAPNLHVTLLFLGDVDDRDLPAVCRAASAAASDEPPFPMSVSGIGAFPHLRRPKVLWAGIAAGADELIRIHDRIEVPLLELGCYRREERAYTPHLTLGRAQEESEVRQLAVLLNQHKSWDAGQSVVDEIVVYSSDLRRAGPVYTALGRAALQNRAAE